MAKIITTNFGSIHDALNKMVVAEVKAALRLVPGQKIEGGSLCRVVVSTCDDYLPYDMGVRRVWIDNDGDLCFSEYTAEQDKCGVHTFTENDDLLDITDFQYLIEQMKDKMPDRTFNLCALSFHEYGYAPDTALRSAIGKTLEY